MTLDCFDHKSYFLCIKLEFPKITNFLNATSDDKDLPRFVTKKWIEIYDQSEKNYSPNKETRIKTSMLDQIYAILMMPILVWKEILLLKVIVMLIKEIKVLHFKIMHHSLIAFQKLMA